MDKFDDVRLVARFESAGDVREVYVGNEGQGGFFVREEVTGPSALLVYDERRHEAIVDHDGELVGNDAIAPTHEEVAALPREVLLPWPIDKVGEPDRGRWVGFVGYAHARRGWSGEGSSRRLGPRKVAAGSLIYVCAIRGMRCGCRVELGARAEAGIGETHETEDTDLYCSGLSGRAYRLRG